VTAAGGELLDVLVVGAGPTGLTLAAQLRGLGATVRIVDRQLDRVQESRALGVQPRTLEVLRGLGLAKELIGRGNDAVWVQLHAGGRVVGIRLFGLGLDDSAYPFLLLVSQAETEQVLGDHLASGGVLVERGVELVGFHADPDAVACLLRHRDGRPEQVRARYVVGCDGARSTVRRAAKIAFQGGAYPQTFALADLRVGRQGDYRLCAGGRQLRRGTRTGGAGQQARGRWERRTVLRLWPGPLQGRRHPGPQLRERRQGDHRLRMLTTCSGR
jgi:2-polyprenyl-6-methoxyphenol hydroxylase-like FAD-dependent oxidoreductase